jgi:hypothetical protein
MNALVKKEIRLLLPSWIAAMLLAMVQAITHPYDFYVASLLLFGLALMALTTIGREASLNTFSTLLAQPAERIRIWNTKLSVLAAAFLTVFTVWLLAFGIAWWNSSVAAEDVGNSYNLFFSVCLIATATFSGGLWTTLLLRQLAGAFWLTLLVPATLSGFSGIFLAGSESSNLVIAVLSVVIGVYSIAGFLFARWLFFRAQDIGWSGGVIAMPEWKFLSARAERAGSTRNRKPIYALVKKELQLHQASLLGAAGLLVLHVGIVILRGVHHFAIDSAGAILTAIFWMLWLVMAPVVGSMAVAEERRLGVADAQLCLPISRRLQFVIKMLLTLVLAVFLGGIMPLLIEWIGACCGSPSMFFAAYFRPGEIHAPQNPILPYELGIVVFTLWLALVSFFASTLSKSFLQAIGLGVATFFCCTILVPVFANGRMLFLDNTFNGSAILPLIIAVPTITLTLLWLGYLNFNHFLGDWRLWRRNVVGVLGAVLFVFAGSNALYYRAWEVFEPAEPTHGAVKLSQANPPALGNDAYQNLVVRVPGGRVWFDYVSQTVWPGSEFRWRLFWMLINPLPHSAGPREYLPGADWISATARHVDEQVDYSRGTFSPNESFRLQGYADTIAVKADGTLWVSDERDPAVWNAKLMQFGTETNWLQVARGFRITTALLLKKDGTLWFWGTNHFDLRRWPQDWPGLRSFEPRRAGTESDWAEIYSMNIFFARKTDGSTWRIYETTNGAAKMIRATNYDSVGLRNCSSMANGGAFVRSNGTLWVYGDLRQNNRQPDFEILQSGAETSWFAAARSWDWMVAIKKDGTLWQWPLARDYRNSLIDVFTSPPHRLGTHDDWISVMAVEGGVVSLAADGSLWFWPNPNYYAYSQLLMRLPKQPRFIGNVFSSAN